MINYLISYYKNLNQDYDLENFTDVFKVGDIKVKSLLEHNKTLLATYYTSLKDKDQFLINNIGEDYCDFLIYTGCCKKSMTCDVCNCFFIMFNHFLDKTINKDNKEEKVKNLCWFLEDVYNEKEIINILSDIFKLIELLFTNQKNKKYVFVNFGSVKKTEFVKVYKEFKDMFNV